MSLRARSFLWALARIKHRHKNYFNVFCAVVGVLSGLVLSDSVSLSLWITQPCLCTPGRVTCTLGAVRCGRGLQLGGLETTGSGCASNPGQPGGAGGVLSVRPMHPAPPPRAPWPQSTSVPRPVPPQSASRMRCPAPRWGLGRTPHRTRHGCMSSSLDFIREGCRLP